MTEKLHIIGEICQYAIYGFLIFVLFVILSPRLPTKNLLRAYVVPTGSMYPAVRAGSVSLVNPREVSPQIGQIIAFQNPNDNTETILHRVVAITDGGYKTKGDNNNTLDNWTVPKENIQGTLVFAIPSVGNIAAFVKKPLGFFFLAIIPAGMLALSFLWDIKNGVQEEIHKHKQKRSAQLVTIALLSFFIGFVVSHKQVSTAYAAFIAQARVEGISISAVFMASPSATPTPSLSPTPSPSPTPAVSPSPTGSPTSTPTITPTPTPTSTPKPDSDCSRDFWIEGDDFFHGRHAEVHCSDHYIHVRFRDLFSFRKIRYFFNYDCDQGPQGVIGDINPDGEITIDRDLYMGSCSTDGICTPNTGVKNRHLKLWYE